MPFDPVSLSPATDAEAAALAFAASLDALLAETTDETVEETLLQVGNLIGGLSAKGFAHDLRTHLASVEEDMLGEAGDYDGDYGPRNPYARLSDRLSDAIDQARADDCAEWLESAKAVMTRVLVLLSEQAA